MSDDLERFYPELNGRIALEHYHRYLLARDHVSGQRVLDVACGEGYGSVIMASVASSVVGMDIDSATIAAAQKRYNDAGPIEFVIGDCRSLPFPDASFDAVVSFETIEHIRDHETFLAEIKRVLVPGGLLLMSTPNTTKYAQDVQNPYHLRELNEDQFRALLSTSFTHTRLYGQRFVLPSLIWPIDDAAAHSGRTQLRLCRRSDQDAAALSVDEPLYFIALCSDRALGATGEPQLYLDTQDDLWLEHERVMRWASSVHNDTAALRERLEISQRDLAVAAKAMAEVEVAQAARSAALTSASEKVQSLSLALEKSKVELESSIKLRSTLQAEMEANAQRLAEQAAELDALKAEAVRSVGEREQTLEQLRALHEELDNQTAKASRTAAQLSSVRSQLSSERIDSELRRVELERWSDAARRNEQALNEMHEAARIVAMRRSVVDELGAASANFRRSFPPGIPPYSVYRGHLVGQSRTAPRRRLSWVERRRIEHRIVFDREWYLLQNPDVAESGADPLEHFLRHGIQEERDPNSLFSAAWYRSRAPERLGDMPAYAHFLADPARRAWPQHPLFDAQFYVITNADLHLDLAGALDHFVSQGASELRDPHPLLSMRRLAGQSGFEVSRNILADYLCHAENYGASPSPLFDGNSYLLENPELGAILVNPLLHYCATGWREGRNPHRLFAGDWYLAGNPDVLRAGMNPLEHYVVAGADEGRRPHPLFDPDFYIERLSDRAVGRRRALTNYIDSGAAEARETTRMITVEQMRGITPGWAQNTLDPITAFVRFGRDKVETPTHFVVSPVGTDAVPRSSWPPRPNPIYWLPQALRDYIIDRFGEDRVNLYTYLMSLIERFGDAPDTFPGSSEFRQTIDRLNQLTEERTDDSRAVDVSIVIPVYNNQVFTLTSIISILENPSRYRYEIIVGDDKSTDLTPKIFSNLPSVISLISHGQNLGFLDNCNACAAASKGRYLVMLNNDTLVMPGWLDELIDPLVGDPEIGMTGSKLLNSDGSLQEAGGILWKDGSAWNFGRNSDPRRPEFNYLKDIDYVSGASIAFPRDLWDSLGGFDREFWPAYCEDSDIAFRIRAVGRRTVYAPQSELIHHEGRSHGRETTSGIKAYQVENNRKLIRRWKSTLENQNFANSEHVFLARDRSRGKPHVLIVDHYIPQWDRDAGSRTMYHFIRMFLSKGFRVTFWPDNLYEDVGYCRHLQKMGVEVIYSAAYVNRFPEFIATNGRYFDYVLLSRPHISVGYYSLVRIHSRAKIIYYGHDVHFLRMKLEYETNPTRQLEQDLESMKALELENWRAADVVLYPSNEEREAVLAEMPDTVVAQVPMLGYTQIELEVGHANLNRFAGRSVDDLVFVGGSHPPNVDALRWFAFEVFPLVLKNRPTARLNIVGSSVLDEIRALASDSVVIRGRLSDQELGEIYATAGVAIVPLRFGAGVKGKTVEALFNAIPVVATSVGMQGLHNDTPIGFGGDTATDFANAVLQAQTNRLEALTRVRNGLAYIEAHFSLDALTEAFAPFVRQFAEPEQVRLREPIAEGATEGEAGLPSPHEGEVSS